MTPQGSAAGSASPDLWDHTLMRYVTQLNEQLLLAMRRAADGSGPALCTPLVPALRPLWRALSPEHCRRLAACPYLLLDAGFATAERWSPAAGAVQERPAATACFLGGLDSSLWRQVVLLGWYLARVNPLLARLALELGEPARVLLLACGPLEIDGWARRRPDWVRPRWEDRPEVWRQLLRAAAADRPELLQQLQLRGVQLLAGSLAA